MSKLTAKEMFLILLLVNFVAYYVGYLLVFNPLLSLSKEKAEAYNVAAQENKSIKEDIEKDKTVYVVKIQEYKEKQKGFYEKTYPKLGAAGLQILFADLLDEKFALKGISVENAEKEKKGKKKSDENTTENSIFSNYIVTVEYSGSYADTIRLIESIEQIDRTASLVGLELNTNAKDTSAGFETALKYNVITVDKGDKNSEDEIYERVKAASDRVSIGGGTMLKVKAIGG